MNALAHRRLQPLRTETFETFALGSRGNMIPLEQFETLDECVEHGAMRTAHKEKFVVRQANVETGSVTLRVYGVKRKATPDYVFRDHAYHREHRMYPEHLVDIVVEPGR